MLESLIEFLIERDEKTEFETETRLPPLTPYYKLGKSVRFREKDIEEWLEKRRWTGRVVLKCG